MKKYKKLHIFAATVVIGALVTSRTVFVEGFTEENIRGWILNALTVSAILGVIVVKYLKHKGRLN